MGLNEGHGVHLGRPGDDGAPISDDRLLPHAVKKYQTIGLISAVGAEAIQGRGTRMWEVKEVKKGKLVSASRMLKDSRIDSDHPCEHAVIKNIFEDAKRLKTTEDREP